MPDPVATESENEREPMGEDIGDDGRMSFVEHLRELRRRIAYCVVFVFVVTLGAFSLREQIFDWIIGPLQAISGKKMQVLGVVEIFIVYLKLSVMAAIFLSSPFILLEAWLFVAPGLYRHEKKWLGPFVMLGTLFFVGGGAFAFYVVMPFGFAQLVEMVPKDIEANYRVADYIGLVIRLLLAFGLVFELPLIMWILAAAGIVSPRTMARGRKYWVVIAAVLAAFLTPPDPATQIMMLVPLVFFFELGLLGARLFYRRRAPR